MRRSEGLDVAKRLVAQALAELYRAHRDDRDEGVLVKADHGGRGPAPRSSRSRVLAQTPQVSDIGSDSAMRRIVARRSSQRRAAEASQREACSIGSERGA